jgi:hypothetical protein
VRLCPPDLRPSGKPINEHRNPRTSATVNQLMDRYLELLNVDTTTKKRYESVIGTHIRTLLGRQPLSRLDGETFDSGVFPLL